MQLIYPVSSSSTMGLHSKKSGSHKSSESYKICSTAALSQHKTHNMTKCTKLMSQFWDVLFYEGNQSSQFCHLGLNTAE